MSLFVYSGVLAADPPRDGEHQRINGLVNDTATAIVGRINPGSWVQVASAIEPTEQPATPWSVAIQFTVRVVVYPATA